MALLGSLFLAPVTGRAVGTTTERKKKKKRRGGALDQSKKERASGVLLFSFQHAQSPSAAGYKTKLISA